MSVVYEEATKIFIALRGYKIEVDFLEFVEHHCAGLTRIGDYWHLTVDDCTYVDHHMDGCVAAFLSSRLQQSAKFVNIPPTL